MGFSSYKVVIGILIMWPLREGITFDKLGWSVKGASRRWAMISVYSMLTAQATPRPAMRLWRLPVPALLSALGRQNLFTSSEVDFKM